MCFHCSLISGTPVTRTDLGLPENWSWIENWLNDFEDIVQEREEENPLIKMKNPEKIKKANPKMLVFLDFFSKTYR